MFQTKTFQKIGYYIKCTFKEISQKIPQLSEYNDLRITQDDGIILGLNRIDYTLYTVYSKGIPIVSMVQTLQLTQQFFYDTLHIVSNYLLLFLCAEFYPKFIWTRTPWERFGLTIF